MKPKRVFYICKKKQTYKHILFFHLLIKNIIYNKHILLKNVFYFT